jgi:DnaK suppressor protein
MTKTQAVLEADAVPEFRERLRNARGELLRTVLLTGDEMRGLGDREPGTLIEDSARGVMTDLVASLNGRERRELDEIQQAMARLETGSFGVCEICGASISLSRLRAIPWARHCLACQFQQERRA